MVRLANVVAMFLPFLAWYVTTIIHVHATPMTASLPNHQPITPLKRTLVLLDEASLKNTSFKYFDALSETGYKLKFKKLVDGATVVVQANGEFEYDNVILILTGKTAPSDRSINNLLDFVDAGGNLLFATQVSTKWARDLAFENGVTLGETVVIDRFPPSNGQQLSIPWPKDKTSVVGPAPAKDSAVLYQGISTEPTADAIQLGAVRSLSATSTAYQAKSAVSGSKIGLISSVQMRNNARVTVCGSVEIFQDSVSRSNREFLLRLSQWTFADALVLRVKSWTHRKTEGTEPERQVKHALHLSSNLPRSHFPDPEWGPNAKIYRIRDEVEYKLSLEVSDFDGKWRPYVANDVQVEFAMLDPYQRRTFESDGNGNYISKFMLPDQYGTFAFRVVYNRPTLSRIRLIDSVNVRPFRHDEYERFIPAAFTYYSAVAVVMIGFLFFSVSFTAMRRPHVKTE